MGDGRGVREVRGAGSEGGNEGGEWGDGGM